MKVHLRVSTLGAIPAKKYGSFTSDLGTYIIPEGKTYVFSLSPIDNVIGNETSCYVAKACQPVLSTTDSKTVGCEVETSTCPCDKAVCTATYLIAALMLRAG